MPRFARLEQRQNATTRELLGQTRPAAERGQRAVSVGNQRMQRRLRQASAKQHRSEEKPPDADEQATQLVEILRTDAEDQSGQARQRIESLPPDERQQVMGRMQDKMSESEFSRVSPTLDRPAPPLVQEGPPAAAPTPLARTAEPLPEEQEADAVVEEEASEEKEQQEEKPRAKKKEPLALVKPQEPDEAGSAPAPEAKEAPVAPLEEPAAATPKEGAAAEPEKAKAKEPPSGAGKKAPVDGGAPSGVAQETASKALDQVGAPPESRTAVRGGSAPAKAGPAPAVAGPAAGFAGGGGGGGGGGEAALAEAPAESPEAEETEERMAAAERDEDEMAEPEPQEDMSAEKALAESDSASPAEMEAQQKEVEEQDAASRSGREPVEDDADEDAPPAEAAALPAAERDAALESIGEVEGGGGAGGVGGGGGGGSAIAAPKAEEAPDVAGVPPAEAMATVSSLNVGQIAAAISGVSESIDTSVSQKKSELDANPPEMDRPSGAPQTKSVRGAREGADRPRPKRVAKTTPEGKGRTAAEAMPEPGQLPPSPTDQVAVPSVSGDESGKVSADEIRQVQGAVEDIPTTDPALAETAGPPPTVELTHEANPARAHEQRAELEETTARLESEGATDVRKKRGEDQLYPTMQEETLTAARSDGGGAATAVAEVEAGDETANIVAEQKQGDAVREEASSAQSEMVAAETEHVEGEATERSDHDRKVQEAVEENEEQQTQRREEAQAEVEGQRGDWTAEQRSMADGERGKADTAMTESDATVEREQADADRLAAAEIDAGNAKADAERQEAERKAREEKRKADEESEGFFGWLASKAKALVNRIASAIGAIFDYARDKVRKAIRFAQEAAAYLVDKARNAIISAIRVAGSICMLAADVLLAGFPALRDRVKGAIRATVSAAEDAVNALADALKRGIQALLDLYLKAIDALLGLLEKGLKAAVQAVGNFVDGVIKAAKALAAFFGIFWQIIKDVASGPIRWLSNLGASIMDGIENHLWTAFKTAVKNWFNGKLDAVLGLGTMVWNALKKGAISFAEVGTMAFEALKAAIPMLLIRVLIENLVKLIVPVAGAVMVMIEALQAAWGTIKQVFAAIGLFVDFLKAVKGGNAGPKFATAAAAGAVVVLEFVSNFFLAKLISPAKKVGQKIKGMAAKITAKLKKAGQKIARSAKKAVLKGKKGLQKLGKRLGYGKKSKSKKKKLKKQEQRDRERLEKAVRELRPKISSLVKGRVSGVRLRLQLGWWRLAYRIRSLSLLKQGNTARVEARNSPGIDVIAGIVDANGSFLRGLIREVAEDLLLSSHVRDGLARLAAQRQAGYGSSAAPLELPEIGSVPIMAADVRSQARPSWTREHFEFGNASSASNVELIQTWSQMPGHIRVVGPSTYTNLSEMLSAWEPDPMRLASNIEIFQSTGRLSSSIANTAENRARYSQLAALAGVEGGRDLGDLSRRAMLMDLMKRGIPFGGTTVTASDLALNRNLMAEDSPVRTAHEVNRQSRSGIDDPYATPANRAFVQRFIDREKQLMVAWLYGRMTGTEPLFSGTQDLRSFIRNQLGDHLRRLLSQSYGA